MSKNFRPEVIEKIKRMAVMNDGIVPRDGKYFLMANPRTYYLMCCAVARSRYYRKRRAERLRAWRKLHKEGKVWRRDKFIGIGL